MIDILKMARDYPIVLTSGLASREEIYRLIDACNQYDVPSLLLSQPSNPLTGLKFTELNELIKNEWLWVEQTALTFILEHQDKQDFSHVLTHIPRVIYSSDLGQTSQMDIPEWLHFSKEYLMNWVYRQNEWKSYFSPMPSNYSTYKVPIDPCITCPFHFIAVNLCPSKALQLAQKRKSQVIQRSNINKSCK
ncbi:DUF6282 family protein [Legionella pneumophila]|nr:DUF6282 family protein [Legionella pneumophila]